MTDKPTFRSPLRNEWDRVEASFNEMARKPGREGVMGRFMVDFMPVLVNRMERERDLKTAPADLFDAVAAVAGQMIEEAIEKQNTLHSPEHSLNRMLNMIVRVVQPRVAKKRSSLILPGEF